MSDRAEEIAREIVENAVISRRRGLDIVIVHETPTVSAIALALRAEERARKAEARISVSGYVLLSDFDDMQARAEAAEARVKELEAALARTSREFYEYALKMEKAMTTPPLSSPQEPQRRRRHVLSASWMETFASFIGARHPTFRSMGGT